MFGSGVDVGMGVGVSGGDCVGMGGIGVFVGTGVHVAGGVIMGVFEGVSGSVAEGVTRVGVIVVGRRVDVGGEGRRGTYNR